VTEKTALITGVNGQDGSYLADQLLARGYEVHGTIRRSSTQSTGRIAHLTGKVTLHYADLTDSASVSRVLDEVHPGEVYNLAAMSDVRASFDTPLYAASATGTGALCVLEAVRQRCPEARVYQAGSSEMFGTNPDVPCDESSRFEPASPYAAAKVFAYNVAKNYRDAYGMFVVNGILYNHESPRRGVEFVTRKITLGVAAICRRETDLLTLGNLEASRDWGFAPEYMDAAWRMLQQDEPADFVIATGETHTVREFADRAFGWAGLDYRHYVSSHAAHLERPTEVPYLLGDPSKAKRLLGWEPDVKFDQLVDIMMQSDLRQIFLPDVKMKEKKKRAGHREVMDWWAR
jgi:GDPmannose 4,6-dehydratase